jgi:hypothetical protein
MRALGFPVWVSVLLEAWSPKFVLPKGADGVQRLFIAGSETDSVMPIARVEFSSETHVHS